MICGKWFVVVATIATSVLFCAPAGVSAQAPGLERLHVMAESDAVAAPSEMIARTSRSSATTTWARPR
jgi:hypothetical protein